MGCAPSQTLKITTIPPQYLQKFTQISQIGNPLNINKKYEHLMKIQYKQQVGQNYRKTYAYYALTTQKQIEHRRKQFWETRVSGQPQIWLLIKQVIQSKQQNIEALNNLNKKITFFNNSIQFGVDSKLNRYQIPIFCINQPISYQNSTFSNRNLQMDYKDELMLVTFRSPRYPNTDIKITQYCSTNIQILKLTIKALKQLTDQNIIRLFYNGRQMKQDKTLGNYGYQPGTTIQAIIT